MRTTKKRSSSSIGQERADTLPQSIQPDMQFTQGNAVVELFLDTVGAQFQLPAYRHHWVIMQGAPGPRRFAMGRDDQIHDISGMEPGVFCYIPPGKATYWDFDFAPSSLHLLLPDSLFMSAITELKLRYGLLDEFTLQLNQRWTIAMENHGFELIRSIKDDDVAQKSASQQSLVCSVVTHLVKQAHLESQQRLARLPCARSQFDATNFQKIDDYIWENSNLPLVLDDLSLLASLSKFHFSRMFKRFTGLPPAAYVLRSRILKARYLLIDNAGFSLNQIAAASGFTDQSYMNRCFQKHLGLTPLQYRQFQAALDPHA